MGDTALRVDRRALRDVASQLKQVGGSVIDGAAVRAPGIDAAAAGTHAGVAAAVADLFDGWLSSSPMEAKRSSASDGYWTRRR
ncbi:MAG: hypothetical protein ACRD29_07525 [Acidimicrobiales bacterium]